MFIRGRERIAVIWRRFQVPMEGFVVAEHRGIFEARIVANADRLLDLFLDLSRHLGPRISVHVEDVRANRRWAGDAVPLDDARSEVRRIRTTLAAHAGIECAFSDHSDQVTLSPQLELFVYGVTERWYYFLRDLGLPRYRSLSLKSWRPERNEFPPAPAAGSAARELATRLGLREREA
jgi:hypothetical protein